MLNELFADKDPMRIIQSFIRGFEHVSRRKCKHAEKKLREHLSERQVDKMIEDSFPASDPPSTY